MVKLLIGLGVIAVGLMEILFLAPNPTFPLLISLLLGNVLIILGFSSVIEGIKQIRGK